MIFWALLRTPLFFKPHRTPKALLHYRQVFNSTALFQKIKKGLSSFQHYLECIGQTRFNFSSGSMNQCNSLYHRGKMSLDPIVET